MSSDLVPVNGRNVQLQAPNASALDQLRRVVLRVGLDGLVGGFATSVRVVTVAAELVIGGYYRIRIIADELYRQYEVATILGLYEAIQRGRDIVSAKGWDEDLKQRARNDLDRLSYRRR